MEDFEHSISSFKSTYDSLMYEFAQDSVLEINTKIRKTIPQKLASLRRAKEHQNEELLFQITKSTEVLLQEYTKNCIRIQKGENKLKAIIEKMNKNIPFKQLTKPTEPALTLSLNYNMTLKLMAKYTNLCLSFTQPLHSHCQIYSNDYDLYETLSKLY
ncbi:unnamed protein product [Moneuplotes crassus]|uniref:Uncharacterized protein n=1 Tax=Euplotes crassus TaxID=5936 RepID=A0AAD1XVF4_EUPCR|nr:unnamed protein product [Moneuplotes crassus]